VLRCLNRRPRAPRAPRGRPRRLYQSSTHRRPLDQPPHQAKGVGKQRLWPAQDGAASATWAAPAPGPLHLQTHAPRRPCPLQAQAHALRALRPARAVRLRALPADLHPGHLLLQGKGPAAPEMPHLGRLPPGAAAACPRSLGRGCWPQRPAVAPELLPGAGAASCARPLGSVARQLRLPLALLHCRHSWLAPSQRSSTPSHPPCAAQVCAPMAMRLSPPYQRSPPKPRRPPPPAKMAWNDNWMNGR
jgi:hypothetical protein